MDIEEQIEKAERLESPSLVGLSIRSADDLIHQNYIHPEKYKGRSKNKPKKHLILDLSIGASLDDLISEGALLGSEEDFDKFLDDSGKIKSGSTYTPEKKPKEETPKGEVLEKEAAPKDVTPKKEKAEPLDPLVSLSSAEPESTPVTALSTKDDTAPAGGDSIYENENYSAPNLSEYQLDHQIADHADLLSSVKSYDLSKLPSSDDRERSKSNILASTPARIPTHSTASPRKAPAAGKPLDLGENANLRLSDSLHTPYFASYERSPSRSRATNREKSVDREARSKSTTTSNPHLARGDTYKNIHPDTPLKYERPADFDDEEEEDSRATRQSKPTMGESIAAAEEENLKAFHGEEGLTRDPSLVTTGDYTNFNVDNYNSKLDEGSLYSVRSASSTNYLRNISRSRSRQPKHSIDTVNEKNDANPEELAHEGALISDDPFDQVGDIDNVMKSVVSSQNQDASKSATAQKSPEKTHGLADDSISEDAEPISTDLKTDKETEVEDTRDTSSKDSTDEAPVNDIAAEEKDIETKEQILAESAPTLTASDIKVDDSSTDREVYRAIEPEVSKESEDTEQSVEPVVDEPAEEKIKEAKEQLIAEEAPTVTAADIKLNQDEPSEKTESSDITESANTTASGVNLDSIAKDLDSDDEVKDEPEESAAESSVSEQKEDAIETTSESVDPVIASEEKTDASESKEAVEDEETKPNLVSEVDATVSQKDEAKDIKAEELPTTEDKDEDNDEERKPSLIAEGGIEAEEPVSESNQKLDESVDEEGKSVRRKSETVKDGVETDEHGAKVPVIDFEKENDNVAPETDAPATQPSLVSETANDDKELEAEDAEALEATTGQSKPNAAEPVEKERSKYDSEEENKVEPANESALPEESKGDEIEEEKEIKKDAGDVVEEDVPETDGAVVDIKTEEVPSDDQKVKAAELVADDEKDVEPEDQEKDTEKHLDSPKLKELTEDDTEKLESSIPEKKDVGAEKDAEAEKDIEPETNAETEKDVEPESDDVSAKAKEVPETTAKEIVADEEAPQEKSTPQTASQGWFGLIKQGLGAVVGGGAAADSAKDDEFGVSQDELREHLKSLPVYIYTSLAGGMQIMQRTNRLTTIMQANGVKFEYKDLGTDEEAKKLWRRYALGKTLPGVVRGDDFIGNWQEVDELNEEYMVTHRLWEEL